MDPYAVQTTPSVEEDEWDTDGFVIPSLGIGEPDQGNPDAPTTETSKPPSLKAKAEEHIYLGPHGGKSFQSKPQELASSRKQRFKQKLKAADQRISGVGRENKLENLCELVGNGGKFSSNMAKGSLRDWIDPHCHESQFEKKHPH